MAPGGCRTRDWPGHRADRTTDLARVMCGVERPAAPSRFEYDGRLGRGGDEAIALAEA